MSARADSTVGGPLWQPMNRCRWCAKALRRLWINARYDVEQAGDGTIRCTPAERGVIPGAAGHCVFWYYGDERVMGPLVLDKRGQFKSGPFDPLTLSHHDLSCNCAVSFPHNAEPGTGLAYPWPELKEMHVPWHCGQPMMMRVYAPAYAESQGRPGGWHCRAGGTDLVAATRGARRMVVVPRGCQVVLPAMSAEEVVSGAT
jgi:hypothetical protein